jgi:hypothetical protein
MDVLITGLELLMHNSLSLGKCWNIKQNMLAHLYSYGMLCPFY